MKNRITITKRTYLNGSNQANFEFSDSKGRGCILQVFERNEDTIIRIVSKDKEVKVVVEPE